MNYFYQFIFLNPNLMYQLAAIHHKTLLIINQSF